MAVVINRKIGGLFNMKGEKSNRIIWMAGAFVALFVSFLLCRYVLLGLHGMKQWPVIMFLFGLIFIVIAAIFDGRKVMICTVAGYIGGFVLGMLFNNYGVDQGGGRTSNAWKIWTVSFIVIMIAGILWQLLDKHIKKKKTT